MSDLAAINNNQVSVDQFTPDQLQLITATVAKGASPQELQLFLYRCKVLQLNPLKPGQIHFIKYGSGPGTIVIGIEGFRSTAARSGKHVSTTRGVHRGEDGTIFDGWCRVKRRDHKGEIQEYYEEVPFNEFYNDRNPSWKKMPETMIKKCAEAAVLRMAYPDDLGGIYIDEEKDAIIENQQHDRGSRVAPDQPNADEGDPDAVTEYRVPFGQWAKYSLREICSMKDRETIEKYFDKLEKYIVDGKYPDNHVAFKDFIERMSGYLADLENGVD